MEAQWQPQQLLQTTAIIGRFSVVSGRSKGVRRARPPPRPYANGKGRSSSHGSRGCPLTSGSSGRHGRRWRPVYVGLVLYYSYRRSTTPFFLLSADEKLGISPEQLTGFLLRATSWLKNCDFGVSHISCVRGHPPHPGLLQLAQLGHICWQLKGGGVR